MKNPFSRLLPITIEIRLGSLRILKISAFEFTLEEKGDSNEVFVSNTTGIFEIAEPIGFALEPEHPLEDRCRQRSAR